MQIAQRRTIIIHFGNCFRLQPRRCMETNLVSLLPEDNKFIWNYTDSLFIRQYNHLVFTFGGGEKLMLEQTGSFHPHHNRFWQQINTLLQRVIVLPGTTGWYNYTRGEPKNNRNLNVARKLEVVARCADRCRESTQYSSSLPRGVNLGWLLLLLWLFFLNAC